MAANKFIELDFTIDQQHSEMLMASLAADGYDAFVETDKGFTTYAEVQSFDAEVLNEILAGYRNQTDVSFESKEVADMNWNEAWEKEFEPILVEDRCLVRASFHPAQPDLDHEIIIDPKMSFGTGHHATTYQILAAQLELDQLDKVVMDAGCGTAILAIMAEQRGAKEVLAFDIDDWCVENAKECIALNGCNKIRIQKGSIADVAPAARSYDIILANINRNILLNEFDQYAAALKVDGKLLISGFMEVDFPHFESAAVEHGFNIVSRSTRGDWAMMILQLEKECV